MKQALLFICLLLFGVAIHAQEFRLNAYAVYNFDDKVDSYYSTTSYYNGTVNGGLLWGAGLEYKPHKAAGVELIYLRQDTEAPTEYYDNGVKNRNFDLAMNWLMLGGNGYHVLNPKIESYGGIMLGVMFGDVTNPVSGNSASATKFGWGLRGGINFFASERVGIKLQASLLSAVQAVGGSLYFGTGGAGAGVSSYSTLLQFGLGGGLIFRFPSGNAPRTTPVQY